MTIPYLKKTDNCEQIRDKVATILATQTTLQQALAVAAGDSPLPYIYRVFIERSNPWDVLIDDNNDVSPVVNVYFDSSNFDLSRSNLGSRQMCTSRINIDIFAYAQSEETSTGHLAGDESSAKKCQAAARQIRNTLMHDDNRLLTLAATVVSRRFVQSITSFLVPSDNPAIQRVRGVRVALDVDHNETTDQLDELICEAVNIKMRHAPTGQLVAEIEIEEE